MNTQPKTETEAKFLIPDAAVFTRLQQRTELGAFVLTPVGTKNITDRYLDTATRQILENGYACRIRRSQGRQLLTLKALTPASGHLHRRQEIEIEVKGDDPQAWDDSEARQLLLGMIGSAALQTLFVIHQQRHQFLALLNEQPVIEFSLDEVSLGDEGTVDYFELEAELVEAGTETDLTTFVEALQVNWPIQPEQSSKFERGLLRLNQQMNRETAAYNLTDAERAALQRIAGDTNRNLARRALIVLMSESRTSPSNIAHELVLTARTVRHWQQEFQRQRLAIFPGEVLDRPETQPQAQPRDVVIDKATPKTRRRLGPAVKYPVRRRVGLQPTDTMAEAGRKIIGFHFARMLKHEPGTRQGEDIGALHDMRVAVRRRRAAFEVFGDAYSRKKLKVLQQGLRATGRALGPVRDLDVFIEKMQQYQQSLPEEKQAGVEPQLELWRTLREPARQELRAYLDSKSYLAFAQAMLEFVKTEGLAAKPVSPDIPEPYQLRHIVPRLVYTRYEAVRAYENVLDNASLETLHSLRLACKALRYSLEFFQEILGKETQMVIDEIKAIQDHLGDLNDANVASSMTQDYLGSWEDQQLHLPLTERQSPTQMINYLTARLEERHQLLVTLPEKWAHFKRSEVRRNLALAVAVL